MRLIWEFTQPKAVTEESLWIGDGYYLQIQYSVLHDGWAWTAINHETQRSGLSFSRDTARNSALQAYLRM